MNKLKIKFVDFWAGFSEYDNYLLNTLAKYVDLEISDEPDLIFFSCYGKEYLKYKCIRIFYTAENMRCDFTCCDFALTFDFLDDERHFRLPLYALYIDQYNYWNNLTLVKNHTFAKIQWEQKSKFCCMVVSNDRSKPRRDFFHKLSKHLHVDSGGKYMNNVGGPVVNKLDFIKDYKFVISFENSSYPGYTTEKILEPLMTESIPIYWGNPLIEKDFNKKRFLDRNDFANDEDLIARILHLNENSSEAEEILMQPIFNDNKIPIYIEEAKLLNFLKHIIDNLSKYRPVAKTNKRHYHIVKRKMNILESYYKHYMGKTFR